jgi:hypothetical protein
LEFIFRPFGEINLSSLTQGDIIEKSEPVVERVAQAHQYYAQATDYTHFVVLTQSCDLVRRKGAFKAPYITIAAAKPFSKTLDSYFRQNSKPLKGTGISYFSQTLSGKARQLIERHINNTEPEFFFLPKEGHPNLSEDLVVFLRLTIALRQEHYEVLANAKVAELADVFQAKLGWLTGNIYSRVATPDLEDRGLDSKSIKTQYYEQYIPRDSAVWLSSIQAEYLKKLITKKCAELGRDLTEEETLNLIYGEVPEDALIIAQNIVDLLRKNQLIDPADRALQIRFANVISNEATFKSLVKQSTD